MKRGIVLGAAAVVAAAAATMVGAAAQPGGKPNRGPRASVAQSGALSAPVKFRYWLSHPDKAPTAVADAAGVFQTAGQTANGVAGGRSSAPAAHTAAPAPLVDFSALQGTGYAQSGTALGECTNTASSTKYLVGSANDFASAVSSDPNMSDFSYSRDGGATFNKGMRFRSFTFTDSTKVPTTGNPAVASADTAVNDDNCLFWVGGLALGSDFVHSGVFVAKTSAATLNGGCNNTDACFSKRRLVVQSTDPSGNTLHDREDVAVGPNPLSAGSRLVAVSDTLMTATGSNVELTLCDAQLTSCGTAVVDGEVPNAGGDFVQSSSLAMCGNGCSLPPAGTVYLTWAYYDDAAVDAAGLDKLTVEIRERACTPTSSTTFTCGAMHVVTRETRPVTPATSALKDTAFQAGTSPRLGIVGARLFVVWEACGDGGVSNDAFGLCDDARVRYSYSNDGGATWSVPADLAAGAGHQFQPSRPQLAGTKVVVGYYSTGDALALTGQNVGYDEHLASATATASPPVFSDVRLTSRSTWPASDWWGFAPQSIGDTQGIATAGNDVWLDLTANYLDECPGQDVYGCTIYPASQQDTFLDHYVVGP